MYMGHIGIGLGARRAAPITPLWILLVAALLPDFVDGIGGVIGWSNFANNWSHTIPGVAVETLVIALVCLAITGKVFAALIAALVAVSHLGVDLITSYISLWPGAAPIGLRLYNHHPADFALEGVVVIAGIILYYGSLDVQRRRIWPPIVMLVILLGFQYVLDFVLGVTP